MARVEIKWNDLLPPRSSDLREVETGCRQLHAPLFSSSSPHVLRGKRRAAWRNKNIIPLRKLGPVARGNGERNTLLWCCCAQVKLHWCQPPQHQGDEVSGVWKGWDHFSIDCRVGQCKGHLLWQSGRCCLSACLPVCLSTCPSICFHSACLVHQPSKTPDFPSFSSTVALYLWTYPSIFGMETELKYRCPKLILGI